MLEDARTPDLDASIESGPPPGGVVVPGGPDFEVTCGGCRNVVRVLGDQLGRFVTCQRCGGRFLARVDPATLGDSPHPGPVNLEKLEARIRREFRLDRSVTRPPGAAPAPRGDAPGPRIGREPVVDEVAPVGPGPDEPRPMAPVSGEAEARIGTLEGELDRVRAELESAAIGHRESLGLLDRIRAEADARRAEDRAEVVGLVDRVDQALRSIGEMREERDAALARAGDLERRNGELEERLAALERRIEPEAPGAARLLGETVEGLARSLEEARGSEETRRREIASLNDRIDDLRDLLTREAGRGLEGRKALEEALEVRLSEGSKQAQDLGDRVEAQVSSLEARVEEILGVVERRAGADRSGLEGEVAALRVEVEGWAARLASVESAAEGLRALKAELAGLRAGLEGPRAGSASGPREVAPPAVPAVDPGEIPTARSPEAIPEIPKVRAPVGPPVAIAAPTPARQGQEPSIILRGVSKEYRRDKFRVPVLEDLDLTVEPGEFLALMGPSGSGKTTLLNLIAGLDQATAGSVVVHGRELTGLSEAGLTRWRANNVGFVFQMYNLIPVMTAQRNVELPLLLTRLSGRRRRENARTALRVVGLEGREDHYPRQLSGGQEQRVSIARAIVTDPHLIVADEPTGDLDRRSAGEILDLLESLNREFHKTIVMVTHDPLAARRATRTLHLDKGRLVADIARPRIRGASSTAPVPAVQPRSPGRSA